MSSGLRRSPWVAIAAQVGEHAEVLIASSGIALFVDDVSVRVDLAGWRVCWVTDRAAPPPERSVSPIPRIEARDDFMRKELELHPYAVRKNVSIPT
ncbi:MAG: hypothetical protein HN742_09705 [Lentisphaerae bacterium]|jgi:hypothetical protein|nr:hypothetical protein [Lentisphaerota bacterium]MBT4823288.1 hypothetical protein [Lentisphaerota bacterium]MBT5611763.1 hypothetical protein [Lentisphaerota bacterium]MBT7062056.1 hypothetical protein [Lentisphaerota bacterium]MBT7842138.1 hypothetical protein [Lentisphaerota bacterium]